MNRFMELLALEVADLFPVEPGESIEAYWARVRAEPLLGKRALIAASVQAVWKQVGDERQRRKTAWIEAARRSFAPGGREPCAVCGRYQGLSEADHTLPLALQFEAGAQEPEQEHDWLCPTHHAAQHVLIDALMARRSVRIEGVPDQEIEALHRLGARMVALLVRLPQWHLVRR